jgi:cyclopropane fatty-acyl-phospholipid synthase-like methyltransferase
VTAVDVSPEQVRRARENVSAATFLAGDMLAVELAEEAFDAAVSLCAIDHVRRERHLDVFLRIRNWLRPGGLALVAIEDVDEPGIVTDWLGAPMFFSAFPAQEERRLAELARLEILAAEVEAQWEQGREVPYLWLLARRPLDVREAGSTISSSDQNPGNTDLR